MQTVCLLRSMLAQYSDSPWSCRPMLRAASPSGGSILMTSAPKSASSRVQTGPAMVEHISITR